MQQADYDLIHKKGRLTKDEQSRLEKEIKQGNINLPDTNTPSIFIAKAHKDMRRRLAREYYRTFCAGIGTIFDCGDHIEEIRAYLQETGDLRTNAILTGRALDIITAICKD